MLCVERLVVTPSACNAVLLGLRRKAYAGVQGLCLLIVINRVIATANLLLLLFAAVHQQTAALSHDPQSNPLQHAQPGMHVRCGVARAVHTYGRCALSDLGLLHSGLPDFSNACLLQSAYINCCMFLLGDEVCADVTVYSSHRAVCVHTCGVLQADEMCAAATCDAAPAQGIAISAQTYQHHYNVVVMLQATGLY